MVHAEEPADSETSTTSNFMSEVQSGFDVVSSINEKTKEKKDFEIKASKVKATSAVLKWNSSDICISYRICKYNVIKDKWEEYATIPQNVLKLRELKPNTTYKYCVINAVSGELLGVAEFTTSIKKPVVTIEKRDGDAIKVGIKNVMKGAKVELYRREAGTKKYKKIATLSSKKKNYTDKNLKGATAYYYKARTVATNKVNGKTKTKKSAYCKAKKGKTLLSMGLPSVSGRTKTYAFYTAVTLKSSPQYKLLRSSECYTDEETGIRMVDGCYCVALGSYYGTKIGTKYRITFSTGNQIEVILCDQKADRHTDSRHQYAVNNSDIVEFYVERSKMPRAIRNRGNYGLLDEFSGSIVAIEKYV